MPYNEKNTKFESDQLKTNKHIASQSSKILQTFFMVGSTNLPPTLQMPENFHNSVELYLCLLTTYHFEI